MEFRQRRVIPYHASRASPSQRSALPTISAHSVNALAARHVCDCQNRQERRMVILHGANNVPASPTAACCVCWSSQASAHPLATGRTVHRVHSMDMLETEPTPACQGRATTCAVLPPADGPGGETATPAARMAARLPSGRLGRQAAAGSDRRWRWK
jgi:hypothetical protein